MAMDVNFETVSNLIPPCLAVLAVSARIVLYKHKTFMEVQQQQLSTATASYSLLL